MTTAKTPNSIVSLWLLFLNRENRSIDFYQCLIFKRGDYRPTVRVVITSNFWVKATNIILTQKLDWRLIQAINQKEPRASYLLYGSQFKLTTYVEVEFSR